MGNISDDEVEWAVVNRLKAMLDEPPQTKFNVTQAFAHFTSILLWTKNRAWVPAENQVRPADHAAASVREAFRQEQIVDEPWLLSQAHPRFPGTRKSGVLAAPTPINDDFAAMTAEAFFEWLRHAIAHGDGRNIKPLHKPSARSNKTWLAGFRIEFTETQGSARILTLHLYHQDVVRLGRLLAGRFCDALRQDQPGIAAAEQAGKIEEVA